jgi:hypothetical protein
MAMTPGTEVDILPIVMSRTGKPHSSTITSLTSLLTLRTGPLDKLISKARLDTSRIIAQLRTKARDQPSMHRR